MTSRLPASAVPARGVGSDRTARGDPPVSRFMEWTHSVGIAASPKVSIESADTAVGGRRVVCNAPVACGEVLVLLPSAAAVSVETTPQAAPPEDLAPLSAWWAKHSRSSFRLAAKLAWESDRFGPYLDMLPEMQEIEVPCWWGEADLRFVSKSLAVRARARRKALEVACLDFEAGGFGRRVSRELFLRGQHAAASRAFCGEAAQGAGTSALAALGGGVAVLFGATSAVASGAVSIPEAAAVGAGAVAMCGVAAAVQSGREVLSLLPMVDQVNHASGPPPDLQFDPVQARWELRAGTSYEPGDEVVFSYGDKDSDTLLLQHGFVEENNPSDTLDLPIPGGLSDSTQASLNALGAERLRFLRGGAAVPVAEEGAGMPELPAAALAEVAAAALRAVPRGGLCEARDEEVRAAVALPARAELILSWRRARRQLVAEAEERWA